MSPNVRVSFQLQGRTAYGTTCAAEAFGRVQVAVDPNSLPISSGVLSFVIWIPVTSLTIL